MPERTIDRVVRQLDNLPTPQVENLKKASDDQLREEFLSLRLWCASVLMWMKDLYSQYKGVEKDYAVLHGVLSEMRSRIIELETKYERMTHDEESEKHEQPQTGSDTHSEE